MVLTTPVKMQAYSPQKMHIYSCMRTYATVQKLLVWKVLRTYFESCIVQTVVCCSLLPPILLSRPNLSPDAVRSRNPSKSTLAHDAIAAAVLHKHHSIIRVGVDRIQSVCRLHSRLAADLILNKVLFSPWFLRGLLI